MFVTLLIEGFAELESLLLGVELDLHRPAGAGDRGVLAWSAPKS